MAPFKVIIAGGSLVGLSLALVFERMGVDYVVLEKGEIAPQLGASIGLHPHSLKILDQLGVWKAFEKETVSLEYREHLDGKGNIFEKSWVLKDIEKDLKRPIIFLERWKALRILYEHVQFKDRIHADTSLVSYTQNDNGVSVRASDGSTHHGDILIGADGIHSRVRQLMSEEIRAQDPRLSQEIIKGFTSAYKTLFAVSKNDPTRPFLPDQYVQNVYYDGFSGIAATGVPGLVFWFLFVRTDHYTTPDCPRYNDADAQALIDQYGSANLGPNYTFADLWGTRVKANLVSMEEGVLKQWSYGRVLCMGDSVHKSTINPGLGGNLAYESIARFTNLLHPLLQKDSRPSTADLGSIFQTFDERHRPRANTVVNISGQISRYESQESWLLKFASRHIVPYLSDKMKASVYCNFSRAGPHLEFLPLPLQDQNELAARKSKSANKLKDRIPFTIWTGLMTLAVAVAVFIWVKPLKF